MGLVLKVRANSEDAIVITHAGEVLTIAMEVVDHGRKVRVHLTAPESFDIVRKEVLERKGAE